MPLTIYQYQVLHNVTVDPTGYYFPRIDGYRAGAILKAGLSGTIQSHSIYAACVDAFLENFKKDSSFMSDGDVMKMTIGNAAHHYCLFGGVFYSIVPPEGRMPHVCSYETYTKHAELFNQMQIEGTPELFVEKVKILEGTENV